MSTFTLTGDHDTDAAALVAIYAQRIGQQRAAAADTTAGTLDAVLSTGRRLDAAAEVFRRRYYPRRHRVAVGLYCVCVVSRTGRSSRMVLDLSQQYQEFELAGRS